MMAGLSRGGGPTLYEDGLACSILTANLQDHDGKGDLTVL